MMSHTGWALFFLVCANQAGVPVPGGASLVAAGALAGGGILSFPLVVAVGVGGTLVADLVWFSLGRWRGRRVCHIRVCGAPRHSRPRRRGRDRPRGADSEARPREPDPRVSAVRRRNRRATTIAPGCADLCAGTV